MSYHQSNIQLETELWSYSTSMLAQSQGLSPLSDEEEEEVVEGFNGGEVAE